MKTITFFAVGDPIGQPRPRAFALRRGGKVILKDGNPIIRAYDPGTAEGWKSQIAEAAKPFIPFDIPIFHNDVGLGVCVSLEFVFKRPGTHFRANGRELKEWAPAIHTSRPDCDNLSKAVLDCLTTLGFWSDDNIVCQLTVVKRYAAVGEQTGCHAVIEQIKVSRSTYAKPEQKTLELQAEKR